MTVMPWFLVCISIFKQGFFLTSYLVFRLPQIFMFFNHIRQQNSLLRGREMSRDVLRACCNRERDLRASVAFHKDALIHSELQLIKIQQGAFSILLPVLSLCLQVLSIFRASDNIHWMTFCVIIRHLVIKEHMKDHAGWHIRELT